MDMTTLEYDSKVDSKKRITLRNATFDFYHVIEESGGRIILEPRELVAPFSVSENTLKMMDASIDNLKKGKASKPLDLSEFED